MKEEADRLWMLSMQYVMDAGTVLGVSVPPQATSPAPFDVAFVGLQIHFLFPNLNGLQRNTLCALAAAARVVNEAVNAPKPLEENAKFAERVLVEHRAKASDMPLTPVQEIIVENYLARVTFR
jgi:hypothetical protein